MSISDTGLTNPTKTMPPTANRNLFLILTKKTFNTEWNNSFYRASIATVRYVVLGVVILSVCLSHAWNVTKLNDLNDALWIFWHHTKGKSLCYSDTNSGWWATPPSVCNLCSKWPTPFKNVDFNRFPLKRLNQEK